MTVQFNSSNRKEPQNGSTEHTRIVWSISKAHQCTVLYPMVIRNADRRR